MGEIAERGGESDVTILRRIHRVDQRADLCPSGLPIGRMCRGHESETHSEREAETLEADTGLRVRFNTSLTPRGLVDCRLPTDWCTLAAPAPLAGGSPLHPWLCSAAITAERLGDGHVTVKPTA